MRNHSRYLTLSAVNNVRVSLLNFCIDILSKKFCLEFQLSDQRKWVTDAFLVGHFHNSLFDNAFSFAIMTDLILFPAPRCRICICIKRTSIVWKSRNSSSVVALNIYTTLPSFKFEKPFKLSRSVSISIVDYNLLTRIREMNIFCINFPPILRTYFQVDVRIRDLL